MDISALIGLGSFLALQTGALIFFAGRVTQKLDDHERRLSQTEKEAHHTSLDVAELKGRSA